MATALGIKKAYDDWFVLKDVPKIEAMCKKYGLYYKFDWVFIPCKNFENVIGGGIRLPTTRMYGVPYRPGMKEGSVHVFFSKSKENLEMCYKNGWYPLIIDNRAIHKPYIDILRFGYFLGYPDCCVDFFRKFNNHFIYNNLYETLKNTKGKPDKFCNSILKDNTFSYIYNIPCSWNCEKTIAYAKSLRKELLKVEPELVRRMDEILQKPLLVINEQNSYIFEGKVKGNSITYSEFKFVGHEDKDQYSELLGKGDEIKVSNDGFKVYKGGKMIGNPKTKKDEGFILDFSD